MALQAATFRAPLPASALTGLSPKQIEAVLAHERTHLRARHDLVLEAFIMLREAFPMLARGRTPLDESRRLESAHSIELDPRCFRQIMDLSESLSIGSAFPGKAYVNRGISGQTTPQMLIRFRPDVIVPVPMFWGRRAWRGANSAEVVAQALSGRLKVPFCPMLARRRNTLPQAQLAPAARFDNVRGAFQFRRAFDCAGARVLLVDDHALLRTGVANIINQEPDLRVVAEAGNGVEALERFARGEPLYRVHECVFGVLALESEPVDPRL